MVDSTLDHIVVAAPTLKSGVEWVRDTLDATPEYGGMHPRMGTHNCLLNLGGQTYLEVIAPDPNAPDPGRPRWFELDSLNRDSPPRLAAWVARSTDIKAAVAAASEPLGVIEPMSRGKLNWLGLPRSQDRYIKGVSPRTSYGPFRNLDAKSPTGETDWAYVDIYERDVAGGPSAKKRTSN